MQKPIILKGKVVHGKGLGRTVGMPTANLLIVGGELPQAGVYATKVRVGNQTKYSVTNIGTRPTVDDDCEITVEVNIFDFNDDIYGENVTLEVYKFLRPIVKFHNLQEVQRQVSKDIVFAKEFFGI